jgi:YD repeat-containing protein
MATSNARVDRPAEANMPSGAKRMIANGAIVVVSCASIIGAQSPPPCEVPCCPPSGTPHPNAPTVVNGERPVGVCMPGFPTQEPAPGLLSRCFQENLMTVGYGGYPYRPAWRGAQQALVSAVSPGGGKHDIDLVSTAPGTGPGDPPIPHDVPPSLSSCYFGVFNRGTTGDDILLTSSPAPGYELEPTPQLPLNLSLDWGPTPGSFLPKGDGPSDSSLPMLPDELKGVRAAIGQRRPVLAGQADLITGMPLVQNVDFELPFGSAVYRHVRTYSTPNDALWGYSQGGTRRPRSVPTAMSGYWDWGGSGWMLGVNPMFLIDAGYWDIDAAGDATPAGVFFPRYCYFIPDAHHTIPFEFDPLSGLYTAPARFRARLEHNGEWNKTTNRWTARPKRFWIYLHDGALTYTIRPIYEDVPSAAWPRRALYSNVPFAETGGPYPQQYSWFPGLDLGRHWPEWPLFRAPHPTHPSTAAPAANLFTVGMYQFFADLGTKGFGVEGSTCWFSLQPISAHRAPDMANPDPATGRGTPYYGLVEKMQDRAGNRIEIEHSLGMRQRELKEWEGDNTQDRCVPCQQDCVDKGQVRTVRLFAANKPTPEWTLHFQYRRFAQWHYRDNDPNAYGMGSGTLADRTHLFLPSNSWNFVDTALHAVYAYEGNGGPGPNWPRVLEDWRFFKGHTQEQANAYDAWSGIGTPPSPAPTSPGFVGLNSFRDLDDTSNPLLRPIGWPTGNVQPPIDRYAPGYIPPGAGSPAAQVPHSPALDWRVSAVYRYAEMAGVDGLPGVECEPIRQGDRVRIDTIPDDNEGVVPLASGSCPQGYRPVYRPPSGGPWSMPPILGEAAGSRPAQGTDALLLLTARVQHRGENTSGGGAPVRHGSWMYRYSGEGARLRQPYLSAIFTPDTVESLIALGRADADPDECVPCRFDQPSPCLTPFDEVCLMSMANSEVIEEADKPLIQFADIELGMDRVQIGGAASEFAKMLRGRFVQPTSGDPGIGGKLLQLNPGSSHGVNRMNVRGESGESGHYRVYKFMRIPDAVTSAELPNASQNTSQIWTWEYPYAGSMPGRSVMHPPYNWFPRVRGSQGMGNATGPIGTDPSKPLWITVIDKFEDDPELGQPGFEWAQTAYQKSLGTQSRSFEDDANGAGHPSGSGPRTYRSPATRRVVQMNVLGYVLSDRTWRVNERALWGAGTVQAYTEAPGEETASVGALARSYFDAHGRVVHFRSAANVAASVSDAATEGLTYFFKYPASIEELTEAATPPPPPTQEQKRFFVQWQPSKVYVCKGHRNADGSAPEPPPEARLVRETEFESSEPARRPDLVIKSTDYPDSVGGGGAAAGLSRTTRYQLEAVPRVEETDPPSRPLAARWRVVEQRTFGEPERTVSSQSSGTLLDLRPFAIERFNAEGARDLFVRGMGVIDVASGALTGAQTDSTVLIDHVERDTKGRVRRRVDDAPSLPAPSSYTRSHHPDAPALADETTYAYDDLFGLKETVFPDRSKHLIDWSFVGRNLRRVDQRLAAPTGGSVTLSTGRPLEKTVTQFTGLRPTRIEKFPGASQQASVSITPTFDSSGRMTKVEVDGGAGGKMAAAAEFGTNSESVKQVAPDGTITRTISDMFGKVARVYHGTNDSSPFWRGLTHSGSDDNMILMESTRYGTGHNDLDLPVEVGRYRHRPQNQYATPILDVPASPDGEGAMWERIAYDWRQREVYRGVFSATNAPLTQTITWYDNLDRPRFVAEYGDQAGVFGGNPLRVQLSAVATPQPTDGTAPLPSAASILTETIKPLRLSEKLYTPRGSVAEERVYDVGTLSGTSYTSTITRYDHEGRPVWVASPDGGVRRTVYDARGREVVSAVMSEGPSPIELSRTTNTFDPDGRVIVVARRERMHESDRFVSTYTWNWYDDAGRLILTADLGSGSTEGYEDATPPPERPAQAFSNGATWTTAYPKTLTNSPAELSGAKLTAYTYDDSGRVIETVHPNGTATRTRYDSLGRVVLRTEIGRWNGQSEYSDQNPPLLQQTFYVYESDSNGYTDEHVDRIVAITDPQQQHALLAAPQAAVLTLPADATNTQQTTWMRHGAPIVSAEVTQPRIGWTASALLSVGGPGATAGGLDEAGETEFAFGYYSDGLLAYRVDRRGQRFEYRYDEASRLVEVRLPGGTFLQAPTYPRPVDPVRRVRYEYDGLGRVQKITAYGLQPPPPGGGSSNEFVETLIAQNEFTYGSKGELRSETQSHGQPIHPPFSPRVDYKWAYQPSAGANAPGSLRLASIEYPFANPTATTLKRRLVEFSYGTGPSSLVGATFGLVTQITDVGGALHPRETSAVLATFAYTGGGREVERVFGPAGADQYALRVRAFSATANPLPLTFGYDRLDRFGRTKDLVFESHGSVGGTVVSRTVQRHTYEYDQADNRTSALAAYRPGSDNTSSAGGPPSDVLLDLHEYDELGRLVKSTRGPPNTVSTNHAFVTRDQLWRLDNVGNWGRPGGLAGYELRTDADGIPGTETYFDFRGHDRLNRIVGQSSSSGSTTPRGVGYSSSGGGTPTNKFGFDIKHDAAGNLLADESYVYFYDGWNRLLQVNRRGTAAFAEIEPRITIAGAGEPNAGVPTVSAPTPSATTPIHRRAWALANNGTGLGPWVVHYTYDGLGRLIRKQVPTDSGQAVRSEHFYYDGARRIQEQVFEPLVLPTGGGGRAASAEQELVLVEGQSLPGAILREFVHAPGYVDRLVCVFSGLGSTHGGVASSLPLYYVQDASYTVTGLVDSGGAVLEQYRYDPYGRVVQVTNPTPGGWSSAHRRNAVGHQGLFFDRLEAVGPATTGGLGAGGRQLVADAALALSATPETGNAASPRGLYQNRNRTLDPVLGRFLQRDPNASGSVVADLGFGASRPVVDLPMSEPDRRLTDGVHLAQYVGSNPVANTDANGLILGPLVALTAGALIPSPSDVVMGMYKSLISEYISNLDWDIDWASDWGSADDWSSREDNSWVNRALAGGAYESFEVSVPGVDLSWNPLDTLATSLNPRKARNILNNGLQLRVNVLGHQVTLYKRSGYTLVDFPKSAIRSGPKPIKIKPTGTRGGDANAAWKESGLKREDYPNHDWHHGNARGQMFLIPREIHRHPLVRHAGGWAIWGVPK